MTMPVPVSMARVVIRMMPEVLFEKMKENTPAPYGSLLTKESLSWIVGECVDVFKENKGLEAIHIETQDGTFLSVKL